MKPGDSVIVIRNSGPDHMGRTGRIKKMWRRQRPRPRDRWGLSVDVRLDFPLVDGRRSIWFSESELLVI